MVRALQEVGTSEYSIGCYRFRPSAIERKKKTKQSVSWVPIAEFGVRVRERLDVHGIGGVERRYMLELRSRGRVEAELTVGADELSDASLLKREVITVAPHLPIHANEAEHLRAAMQSAIGHRESIEGALKSSVASNVTGWVRFPDGSASYVFANASVGRAVKFVGEVEEHLPRLRCDEDDDCSVEDIHELLCGPPHVSEMLSAIAPLATIAPILARHVSPTSRGFMIGVDGTTGQGKTVYGNAICRPLGIEHVVEWTSTPNDIERRNSVVGDAPLVTDDYKPSTVRVRTAIRIFQNHADGTKRGRMTGDMTAGKTFPPRAIMISTGEDLPVGEPSALGRGIWLTIEPGDINGAALVFANSYYEAAHRVVVAYLDWLAPQFSKVVQRARAKLPVYMKLIAERVGALPHGRSAEVGGLMLAAAEPFFEFASERLDEPVDELMADHVDYLVRAISKMRTLVRDRSPGSLFMDDLRTAWASGRVRIDSLKAKTAAKNAPRTAPVVGFVDKEKGILWILPGPVWHALEQQWRSGSRSKWSTSAVNRALYTEGFLARRDAETYTVRRMWHERQQRMLAIKLDRFLSSE